MRITMKSIHYSTLVGLNKINADLARLNTKVSSGKELSTISDDPVNMVVALGLRSSLSQIGSYQDNLNFGDKVIAAAESSLTQMNELVMRAKTLAIQQANATFNSQDRASAAEEVRHLWEEAIALANTEVNGKYVFGGYRTSGYTAAEPEPFIAGLAGGYRVNGQTPASLDAAAASQYHLSSGDLSINGTPIAASVADGLSTAHASASAAAKAKVINDVSSTTGVTAEITPAGVTAAGAVTAGTLGAGDLLINGQDIFSGATAISSGDSDNVLVNAINAKSSLTGVVATRDSNGVISLSAVDGRNIQVTTTADGETVTSLNGGAGAADKVYFGAVQLSSDLPFTLKTIPAGPAEPGLDALGLGGGSGATGESGDTDGDGLLNVVTIRKQDGNVRYAGDPDNDLAIKVGKQSTLEVGQNGKAAVMDTGIFAMLKKLEESLRGENFTAATGLNKATNINAKLDSGATGLAQQGKTFTSGTISITVRDNSTYPPTSTTMTVAVDPSADSPAEIAARLNGIPGLTASWDSDGRLQLASADPDRYSFSFTDSSNFMELSGISRDSMQVQAIGRSISEADTVMDNIIARISDFGARANRIDVQRQIYTNLELTTTENLSEAEDADMIKTLMELRSKETAYQATLAAAAKVMQLSLVDYLK